MKLFRNLDMSLLAIWLILPGLLPLVILSFPASGIILTILAVASGILILFR